MLSLFWKLPARQQGVHRATFLPETPGEDLSCLSQLLGALGFLWLMAASLQSLPLSSKGLLLCVSVCPFVSLTRTLIGFRATLIQCDLISILTLLPSSKTLCPNKVTFCSSK